MKQALIKKGIVYGEEVPAPVVSDGSVLIKVVNSCISAGTEISGMISSGTPLIKRIMKQPEKLTKAWNLVRSEGISKAYKQIHGEMEAGKPTGYSISGMVVGIGKGVSRFQVGDRVAAAGGGMANHAGYVDVPVNLVVKIPESLGYPEASTVTLGAIAMHGVRRANLSLGEFCVVYGTGILGLLAIQILKASGIRVVAIDIDHGRLAVAKKFGTEQVLNPNDEYPVKEIFNLTGGYGTDAVLFTASTTSNEPLSHSFKMCRKKGKVVLVGVSGMEINRADIYQKEIDFMISTSYGPGRYDDSYEKKGIDYPYHYVRWTENRNLSEYLRLINNEAINLSSLITKVFPVEEISEAFNALKIKNPKPLMVLLDYGMPDESKIADYREHERKILINTSSVKSGSIRVALIGAGNFATHMHLPNLRKLGSKYQLIAIVDRKGHKAKAIGEQYGAKYATTNFDEVLHDKDIDMVMICTRHDSHGELVLKSLQNGKHVFVEKPLATTEEEVKKIEDFYAGRDTKNKPLLMVGFNRRFSKYANEIKKHTDKRVNPLFIHYRMNAGYIPADHWVHENGGRIVGEACHIIDLFLFLTGSSIKKISFDKLNPTSSLFRSSDNMSAILSFEDGSLAVLNYFSTGNLNFPKEYLEINYDHKTIVLDDYKRLEGYGITLRKTLSRPDKGHLGELIQLHNALTSTTPFWPIPFEEMIQTTKITHLLL